MSLNEGQLLIGFGLLLAAASFPRHCLSGEVILMQSSVEIINTSGKLGRAYQSVNIQLIKICAVVKSKCAIEKGNVYAKE